MELETEMRTGAGADGARKHPAFTRRDTGPALEGGSFTIHCTEQAGLPLPPNLLGVTFQFSF